MCCAGLFLKRTRTLLHYCLRLATIVTTDTPQNKTDLEGNIQSHTRTTCKLDFEAGQGMEWVRREVVFSTKQLFANRREPALIVATYRVAALIGAWSRQRSACGRSLWIWLLRVRLVAIGSLGWHWAARVAGSGRHWAASRHCIR